MIKELKSEQLPTDGKFKLIGYLDKANSRLKQLGKHGKRATLKRTGSSVVLQFNFGGQVQRSPNCSFTKQGISEAETIAAMVTNQLVANQYSDEWLDGLLGRSKPNEFKKELTCADMINQYKKYWFRESKDLKNPDASWRQVHRYLEASFIQLEEIVSEKIITSTIEKTPNNSLIRSNTLNALVNLFDYFDITEYSRIIKRYKDKNNPKPKNKYIPNDSEIMTVYNLGFRAISF